MKAFDWVSPRTIADAIRQLQTPKPVEPEVAPQAIAGGQDLLTSMKDRILRPPRLVNLKSIPGLDRIELDSSGALRLGALVRMANAADHPIVKRDYPVIAQSLKLELQIDREALAEASITLDQFVSFNVKEATADELFTAALKPSGLSFRRVGATIKVFPATK